MDDDPPLPTAADYRARAEHALSTRAQLHSRGTTPN